MGKPLLEQSVNLFSRIRGSAILWVALIAGYSMPQAFAVDVPTLYSAEVAYDSEARNPRDDAYQLALAAVIARVSGSNLSNDPAAIKALFPNPSAYVMQFRQEADDAFWVSFDGKAIEAVLRRAGETVWGGDRPLTLVWLAVDWGQGERGIIAADDQDLNRAEARSADRDRLLRERIVEIAERRGLPLAFPTLDTTDLQSVTFSDVWGGFDERIIAASERYDANSVLIGRVRASSQQNRWTYAFGGERRNWTGPAESVLGQVADLMAAEFSVGGNAPLRVLNLRIAGVESVDAYGSVQNMLQSVTVVEDFKIIEVAGDAVSYSVEVRGGAERLRRALRFAGLLEQDNGLQLGALDDEPALEFFYNP